MFHFYLVLTLPARGFFGPYKLGGIVPSWSESGRIEFLTEIGTLLCYKYTEKK